MGDGRGRKPLHPPSDPRGASVMARVARGETPLRGSLDRAKGPFRLDAALAEPGVISFEDARDRVFLDWDRQVAAGTVKAATITEYKRKTNAFVAAMTRRYADEPLLLRANHADIRTWLPKPTPGRETPMAKGTQRGRLIAITGFYRTAIALGLCDQNPASGIEHPGRYERYVAPFTDDDIDQLQRTARYTAEETRRPATLGLAMVGATLGENAYTRVCDVDLRRRIVWLHDGGTRTFNRWNPIDDDWAYDALARRIRTITADVDPDIAPLLHVTYQPSNRSDLDPAKELNRRSASTAGELGALLKMANVYKAGITRPDSIREWFAHRIWNETGRLETVAYRLGMSSLDDTATLLGVNWLAHCAPTNTPTPRPLGPRP